MKRTAQRVCVIGTDVKKQLFGARADVVGHGDRDQFHSLPDHRRDGGQRAEQQLLGSGRKEDLAAVHDR